MSNKTIDIEGLHAPSDLLEVARQRAKDSGMPFAGQIYPSEAWALFENDVALLIDVRTVEELKFVGRVPEALHVPWKTWPGMAQNDRFVEEVEAVASKDSVVMLLCRSGVRSVAAAEALTAAGFINAFNILEGFEGVIDGRQHRGALNGWRHSGLPWVQD